ncbi:rhodanese-like domain-containing protein [Ditylenchus destructor]|uniref:Rhodanese-like domain-containing protein n=1 Tax=Ditylenchus destructor TaxID=166010 RepID=A0AAD4MV09_9BILA|nr:rhodanese-like domain-containing protein [Ditylenchus destructor]
MGGLSPIDPCGFFKFGIADKIQTTTESESSSASSSEEVEPLPPIVADTPEGEEAVMNALKDAVESHKILLQNVTIVMPNFNPDPHEFFDSLLRGGLIRPAPLPQVPALPPKSFTVTNLLPGSDPRRPQYNPPNYGGSPVVNPGFVGPLVPQVPTPPKDALIDVEILNSRMKLNKNLKVLDASYEPEGNAVDPTIFQDLYYGKWDKLIKEKKGLQYERSHIPGAIHFNLNVATYPSWNERQALYPADLFQEYVRRLGINKNDEIVVYSRGTLGGMLHAARVWALFRIYGHERIRVLNGGLEAWRRADLPTDNEKPEVEHGKWVAVLNTKLLITFEELTTTQADGYCIFSRLYWYNFLDARPRNEFFGFNGNRLFGPQRSRVSGSKPFPADELIRSDGFFATNSEILQKLQNTGFVQSRQTIVAGNTADEASVVILALKLIGEERARLYNKNSVDELRSSYLCDD